jgi:hypothetical protein
MNHPITNGRNMDERIDSVATFTGQAFQVKGDIAPLLVFGPLFISQMPQKSWEFSSETPSIPVNGWLQGAAFHFGKGRVAVFGEAAMFTAQIDGTGKPMGMNAPYANQNAQFTLNIIHWLSGILAEKTE